MKIINKKKRKESIFWDTKSIQLRKNIQNDLSLFKIKKRYHWWEDLIGTVKNKEIIDIGCGNSYHVTYWNLSGNKSVGIDISPETIENNKLLHEKFGLENSFSICSAEDLNFPSEYFDIVHIQFLLHHLPQNIINIAIKEAFRVLKKEGLLLLFETNYNFPLRWIAQNPFLHKFNFIRRYAILKGWLDPEEKALKNFQYIQVLKKNKFKIIKTNYVDRTFSLLFRMLFNKKIGMRFRRFDRILTSILKSPIFSYGIQIVAKK